MSIINCVYLYDGVFAVTASPSAISPYLNFDPSLINIVRLILIF